MSQYERVLASNPMHAEAHNNLGIILAKQGRLDEAVSQFVEALRIDPDFTKAKRNLQKAQMQMPDN